MRKLIVLVLATLTIAAYSQETWHHGVVVTSEDSVIVGEVLYESRFELVMIRHDSRPRVILAKHLKSFRYFDESQNVNRKFVRLSQDVNANKSRIYEVVLTGKILVVRLPKLSSFRFSAEDTQHVYYFVRDGKIEKLAKFRNRLYPEIRPLLELSEKEKGLDPNNLASAIRYIELFNRSASWTGVNFE